jgi:hypothetical protein
MNCDQLALPARLRTPQGGIAMSSRSHGSLSQYDDGGRRDRRGYAFYACRPLTAECVIRKEQWQTKP